MHVASVAVPEKGRTLPFPSGPDGLAAARIGRLEIASRSRCVRALLEAADLNHELRALLGPVLIRARKRRDRPTALAIEAALAAAVDQAAEVDQAGLCLSRIDALWGDGVGAEGRA